MNVSQDAVKCIKWNTYYLQNMILKNTDFPWKLFNYIYYILSLHLKPTWSVTDIRKQ